MLFKTLNSKSLRFLVELSISAFELTLAHAIYVKKKFVKDVYFRVQLPNNIGLQ